MAAETNEYFTAGNWKLASGPTFSAAEERSGAAVSFGYLPALAAQLDPIDALRHE